MLFNGKYYNKPGHLGMTRAELKEALQGGGGGGYDPDEDNKLSVIFSPVEVASLLSGTAVTKQAAFYNPDKFQQYMTLVVSGTPVTNTILNATVYMPAAPGITEQTVIFSATYYYAAASKAYCITATLQNVEEVGTFEFTANEI